jgi:hypothetical protein
LRLDSLKRRLNVLLSCHRVCLIGNIAYYTLLILEDLALHTRQRLTSHTSSSSRACNLLKTLLSIKADIGRTLLNQGVS